MIIVMQTWLLQYRLFDQTYYKNHEYKLRTQLACEKYFKFSVVVALLSIDLLQFGSF